MCGIAGKVDFAGPVDPGLVHAMCEVIEHRGPDSRGVFFEDGVGLGIQRLAIIDVAGGDQPIFNEDGSVVVVMNGEIYNYRELREELATRGHRFSSASDTEVLVHLYEEEGEELVSRLNGMFAFAIWDKRRERLVVGRDRVGKKPLFWARRGSRFWFGSEVRSLLEDPALERRASLEGIASYLTLQYVPHPLSAFEGIHKLPPASTMVVDAAGERIRRYWQLDYTVKREGSVDELAEEARALVWQATRDRLMSEVPLGAFLSGGIDSSAVVAAMAEQSSEPVKTFSIGFTDADFDELRFAREVAERFGTEHREFVVEPKALSIMPTLARHYGEPFADPSAIPSFYLAELTSRYVTVALNGDGGDESFAGYRRYVGSDLARHLAWLPDPLKRLAPHAARLLGDGPHNNSTRTRIRRLARTLAMTPPDRYALWMTAFDSQRRDSLLSPGFRAALGECVPERLITDAWASPTVANRVDAMMNADVETYLPANLLVKMDIATMAYSVEARSPFLDHRVMEFAASLPPELKLAGTDGKWLLKKALRGHVPDSVLDRPKMGFGVPLARWFREDLRALPREVLLDPATLARGYFRPAAVERLIDDHQAGRADHSLRLWVLLQLESWHREVLEAPPGAAGVVPQELVAP